MEVFVNFEGYVEEFKFFKVFVVDGKLFVEEWWVKWNVDGEIKRLFFKGVKKLEDRGFFCELVGFKKFLVGVVFFFVCFIFLIYDFFEVFYVVDFGKGEFLLVFVLYFGMVVKVLKNVFLRVIDEVIKDVEKEFKRVKLFGR